MNILITGSDRGIGFGLTKCLLERSNSRVIATARNVDNATDLHQLAKQYGDRLITATLDTTVDSHFETLKSSINSQGIEDLDIIIGNAGISSEEHPHDHALTCRRDELINVVNTNVGGNMKLYQTFSDMLCRSRVRVALIVSSKLGSLNCATSESGTTAYRISKAGLNMFGVLFAQDSQINNAGCKVIINHPGHVATYLGETGGQHPKISVEESANGLVDLIEAAASVQMDALSHQQTEKSTTTFEFRPPIEEARARPDLQQFIDALKCDNKVFVNYDGTLIPW